MGKRLLGLSLFLYFMLLFSFFVSSANADSYSEVWYFGYDTDNDDVIDVPMGDITIYLYIPDYTSGDFYVDIELTYNKDEYAVAERIYFEDLEVHLVASDGYVVYTKLVDDESNYLYPGDVASYDVYMEPSISSGNYYLSISFIIYWYERSIGWDGVAFVLHEAESLSSLPETSYTKPSPQPSGPAFGLAEILLVGGVIGVVIVVLVVAFVLPSTSSGAATVVATQPQVIKPSLEVKHAVKLPEVKNLNDLLTLKSLVRIKVLEFNARFSENISNVLISFKTRKGVRIIRTLSNERGEFLLTSSKSFILTHGTESFSVRLYVYAPTGVSLENNVIAKLSYRLKGEAKESEFYPNQSFIEPNIAISFVEKRSVFETIKGLTSAVEGLIDLVADFAGISAEEVLKRSLVHNLSITNLKEEPLRDIKLKVLDKFKLVDVSGACEGRLTVDGEFVEIEELGVGESCSISLITLYKEEDQVVLLIGEKEYKPSDMTLELMNEEKIFLNYYKIKGGNVNKYYIYLSKAIREFPKLLST